MIAVLSSKANTKHWNCLETSRTDLYVLKHTQHVCHDPYPIAVPILVLVACVLTSFGPLCILRCMRGYPAVMEKKYRDFSVGPHKLFGISWYPMKTANSYWRKFLLQVLTYSRIAVIRPRITCTTFVRFFAVRFHGTLFSGKPFVRCLDATDVSFLSPTTTAILSAFAR